MEIISCLLFLLIQLISQSQSHPTLSITIIPVGTCWLTPTFNSSTSLSLTSSTHLYKIYCLPTSNVTIQASNYNDSASAILINGEATTTLCTSLPTPNEHKWIELKYLINKNLFHTYRFQLFLSLPTSSHPSFPIPESSTQTIITNNANSERQKMSPPFSFPNKNNKKNSEDSAFSNSVHAISSSTPHSLQAVQPMTFSSDLLPSNVQNKKLFDVTAQECKDSLCPNQVCLERPSAENGTATYECAPIPTVYYGIMSTLMLTTTTAPFAFLGKEPELIFRLARLSHIDSTRIAVNAIPYMNQTRVIIGVLPVSPYNLSIQASPREVVKILVDQLNNGTLNGTSELGTLTSAVVFGDEAILLNCSYVWQYQCEANISSFKDWMQAVLVLVVVVNVFICTYACCCRNSTLFFVYDKPSRSRTQRELEFGASEKDVNRTPPPEHHTLSVGRGTFDQKRQSSPSATPRLVPMLSPGPASPSGVRIPASPSLTKSNQKEEDFNIPPRSSEEASFSRALSMGSRPGHKTTISTSPTSKGQSPFKMEKQMTNTSLVVPTPSHLNDNDNNHISNGTGNHNGEKEDSSTPEPSPKSSAQHERENLYVV